MNYTELAVRVYEVDPSQVTDEQRHTVRGIVYRLAYGGSVDQRLRDQLLIRTCASCKYYPCTRLCELDDEVLKALVIGDYVLAGSVCDKWESKHVS